MQPPYGMHGPIPPPTNHHHHHHHHGHIPTPPRKKPRRMVEPGGLEECGLKSSESIIREEMRNVVLSRLNLTTTEEDRDIDTNIHRPFALCPLPLDIFLLHVQIIVWNVMKVSS
jgi:hypothetical protein